MTRKTLAILSALLISSTLAHAQAGGGPTEGFYLEAAKSWAAGQGLRVPADSALRLVMSEAAAYMAGLGEGDAAELLARTALREEAALRFGDSPARRRLALRREFREYAMVGSAGSSKRLEAGVQARGAAGSGFDKLRPGPSGKAAPDPGAGGREPGPAGTPDPGSGDLPGTQAGAAIIR